MLKYFSKFEITLWSGSVSVIILSAVIFGTDNYLSVILSLIGATSLILNAKGNVWGQVLGVAFSVIYGIISYSTAYYGEMITYLGMTGPIAAASVVTWLKNPSKKGRNEVKINRLKASEYLLLAGLTVAVTFAFYFILKFFGTSQLILSTVSIATSFAASYLTMRRCEFFALAYAANDIVLIALWALASARDKSHIAMVICFFIFLINDIYGYFNWVKMKKAQAGM